MNLKQKLTDKILGIPGVTIKTFQGKQGEFSSFIYKEKEFAHFHGDTLDLRLTNV